MLFEVHAQNMELSDALRAYVEEKVLEPLKRIIDDPSARLEVRLRQVGHAKHGKNNEVHAHFSAPQQLRLDITETDEDMYRAVDGAHHRLLEAVRRQVEKRRSH
ncbi:MAG: ribosome-associated translation inhibitor RaiA [Myxococcota bacterium]